MPADLTGLTATPTTVALGGTSKIVPVSTNAPQTITINGVDENGNKASVNVTIEAETITLVVASTLPAAAPAGEFVFALTGAGELTVNSDGTDLTYAAPAA